MRAASRSFSVLRLAVRFAGFVCMAIVSGCSLPPSAESRALARADVAFEAIRRYKTDVKSNSNSALIAGAAVAAQQSVSAHRTKRGVALHSLLSVWEGRWHWASKDWNAQEFVDLDLVTEEAVKFAPGEGTAWLSRALLHGNACHFAPREYPRRAELCAGAGALYQTAMERLESEERWLWFEAVWTAAVYFNRLAHEAERRDDMESARRWWMRSWAICRGGEPFLSAAPANDRELVQECLDMAGGLDLLPEYLYWARIYRADVAMSDRSATRLMYLNIYRNPSFSCLELEVSSKNRRKAPLPIPKSPEHYWCAAVGLAALDCDREAERYARRGAERAPGRPWRELKAAMDGGSCYLGEAAGRDPRLPDVSPTPLTWPSELPAMGFGEEDWVLIFALRGERDEARVVADLATSPGRAVDVLWVPAINERWADWGSEVAWAAYEVVGAQDDVALRSLRRAQSSGFPEAFLRTIDSEGRVMEMR